MPLFRRGESASTLDLLVVGLGNPGRRHERDRHNVGFMVVDELARRHDGSFKGKFSGRVAEVRIDGQPPRAARARHLHERLRPLRAARGRVLQDAARRTCSSSTTRSTSTSAACRRASAVASPATTACARSRAGSARPSSCGCGSASAAPAAAILATSPTSCCRRSRRRTTRRRSSRAPRTRSSRSSSPVSRRRSACSTDRCRADSALSSWMVTAWSGVPDVGRFGRVRRRRPGCAGAGVDDP